MKGRLAKLRDIIKDEGFETYSDDDEERGGFTFIETSIQVSNRNVSPNFLTTRCI
jgi:hypothetical protein